MHYKKPPFSLTPEIFRLGLEISKMIGRYEGKRIVDVEPRLRRINTMKTIRGTCAIEGNTLSEEMVTDIINNKKVLAPKREILEVKNALALYQEQAELDCFNEADLLKAHGILMEGLLDLPGRYRDGEVGVFSGNRTVHVGPPAIRVPEQMKNLFQWLSMDLTTNTLIKSAVFHFEYEFIHPFMDGNGRMGRFWQHLLLIKVHPIFRSVPVENIIYNYQQDYYRALAAAQSVGESTPFIEFSLFTIHEALKEVDRQSDGRKRDGVDQRLLSFLEAQHPDQEFSRKQYVEFFGNISPASATKDLITGVKQKLIEKIGTGIKTRYKKMS
ncbi:MAG: Fic family protein [Bdellovibrionales bacterium]|nr:Fic family protein [Bdellovibrionales bacterium]